MADIIQFACAQERELRPIALHLIEELGPRAGYEIGLFARLPSLADEARAKLLTIADLIEREQGYGWYLGDSLAAADR